MLQSLLGYVQGAGLDGRWVVIAGDPAFFAVTKRLHNRLHGHAGDGGELGAHERDVYEACCARNAEELAARVRRRRRRPAPRPADGRHGRRACCETGVRGDLARAHRPGPPERPRRARPGDFLMPYVQPADAYVFSRDAYRWPGLDAARVTVIAPSIDAFSPKNHAMSFTSVTAVLRAAGLAADHHHAGRAVFERLDGSVGRVERRATMIEEAPLRLDAPLVAQVSRWDRAQGPARRARRLRRARRTPSEDPHLVLAGPDVTAVTDDPEGAEVLAEVEAAWRDAAAARPAAGAPRAAADGGRRRERDHRQRAAAARRRRRAEEPGGGLRPHGRRGDVEGPSGRRHARGRHPGPDRATGGPGTSSSRTTWPPSARA